MNVRAPREAKRGFTLMETMIAIVVLTIGILGLAGVLAQGLAFMSMSQYEYIAQQKASEAIESIFTARDQGQLTWTTICNVGSSICSGGIFVNGAQTLCDPGSDGIVGTTDDFLSGGGCSVSTDAVLLPGASGTFSTPTRMPLTAYNFTRNITISAVTGVPNLRTITVTITYQAGHWPQLTYTLTAAISDFS
jgi:prepilin-type N-terminal cleavage/methylation domain-containing protein